MAYAGEVREASIYGGIHGTRDQSLFGASPKETVYASVDAAKADLLRKLEAREKRLAKEAGR